VSRTSQLSWIEHFRLNQLTARDFLTAKRQALLTVMISASEFQESSSDKLQARFALHIQVYLQQIWCRSNTKSSPKSSQVRESVTRLQERSSPSIFSSVGSGRGSRQDSRMGTSKQTKAHCCNLSQHQARACRTNQIYSSGLTSAHQGRMPKSREAFWNVS
jgi:hypothetical protein